MKKFYQLASLLILISLVSCSTDGYQTQTRTITGPAINIITSLDDGSTTVSYGSYVYNLTITESSSTGYIQSPDLIADNTNLGFTTDEINYKSTGYDAYFENVSATAGSTTMQILNSHILAMYPYDMENEGFNNKYGYYYDTTNIGNYTFSFAPISPWITVARYDIGTSYRVNTFPVNTFFKGTTKTTYPQNPEGFVTEDIIYRFIINKDADTNTYTADLVLYNARFAAEMPMSLVAVLVEGLDVQFSASGVNITGNNIIPKWYTSGQFQDLERYIFKSVNFRTTNEAYTSGELNYEVGDDYVGTFEGSYANSFYKF